MFCIIIDDEAPVITKADDVVAECDGTNDAFETWLANNGNHTADDCNKVTWTNDYNQISIAYDPATMVEFQGKYYILDGTNGVAPVGFELAPQGVLANAELAAFEGGDFDAQKELKEVQRDFLNKHLLQWAPMYLINMKFEARTPLYYDAADMALEFILSDNEYLVSELKA